MDLKDQDGTWIYKATMHLPRAAFGCTLGNDGRIYVFGGIATSGFIPDCEVYDPNQDEWSQIVPLPMPIGQTSAAATADGKILLLGGVTTGAILNSSTILYDPTANLYSTLAPLPSELRSCAFSALSRESVIYALSSSETLNVMHSYDLQSDQWRKLDLHIPSPPSSPGCVCDRKGFAYLVGGSDSDGPTSSAYRLDIAQGQWSAIPNMLQARRGHGLAIGLDDRIYAYGGFDTNDVSLGSCEAYDAATNSWTAMSNLNMPREDMGCVSDGNGQIYAIGGLVDLPSRLQTLDSLECYLPRARKDKPFGAVISLQGTPNVSTIRKDSNAV